MRRIVVGLDLSLDGRALTPGARDALASARWLADDGTRVVLLHGRGGDERWESEAGDYVVLAERQHDEARAVLEQAAAPLRAAGLEIEIDVCSESAWLALVRRMLRDEADLALVSKRAQEIRDGRPLGSVAMKLLRKSPGAVWAVQPGSPTPPRRILAATALDDVGRRVLDVAASLADRGGAELHVVHAFSLPMSATHEPGFDESVFVESRRAECTERIRERLRDTPVAGKAHIHAGLTSPTRAVLEAVSRVEPDLVVMGTISRGGVAGLLVGNTAERLLGRLDCSILAVKPDDFVCPVRLDD